MSDAAPEVPGPEQPVPPHTHEAADIEAPSYGASAKIHRPHQATSSVDLKGRDLRLSPYRSAGDLLNRAPGFYVVQHAGGGKANQYFLRGFDADHGTDVALLVDDVPVNAVSHGHGQGFADLHWVIPELVDRIEVRKGPYLTELGDFATAGSARYVLARERPESSASGTYGSFNSYRGVAIFSPEVSSFEPIVAAEVARTDGPFDEPERSQRLNAFARTVHPLDGGAELALTATAYSADWNASGQIPLRAVQAGRLDRFGSIDPDEGGDTHRYSLYVTFDAPTDGDDGRVGNLHLTTWLARYDFDLYSNFTFFSVDPVNGDMIHQSDARTAVGLDGRYSFTLGTGDFAFETTVGSQLRLDDIDNGLDHAPGREVMEPLAASAIHEASVGGYAQEAVSYRDDARLIVGARADAFEFNVEDQLQDPTDAGDDGGGRQRAVIVSPKASLVVSPLRDPEWLEGFINFGFGFHSNDARAVVAQGGATPLARAIGYELGARSRPIEPLRLSAAAFVLHLESELVWVGDEGVTEASGRTRRQGIEGSIEVAPINWLVLDAQASVTDATFVDNPGNAASVALAPTFLLSGGASIRHAQSGVSGRLGFVHVADRPASEDEFLTAEGFTRLDASALYRQPRFALELRVLNLLDTDWRQAQFATTSRLDGETAADCGAGTRAVVEGSDFLGCEDVNFTPGSPIDIQATATVYF